MSTSNLFGPIVTGGAVERAVKAHLEHWLDTYLNELERLEGYPPDTIQRPMGIVTSSEFDKWPEDQLPVLLVIAPGLLSEPVRRGDSSYEARWGVGIAAITSDVDGPATRALALTYAAAIRAAMLQHKSVGGFASFLVWRDENYGDLPFDETRSLGAARVVFELGVETAVREAAGPREPTREPPPIGTPAPDPAPDDPGDWPGVTATETTTTPVPIDEPVHA